MAFKFGRGSEAVHAYYGLVSQAFALVDADDPIPDEVAEELVRTYARIKDLLSGDTT